MSTQVTKVWWNGDKLMSEAISEADLYAQPEQEQWNEDKWRRNNWRCQHGWLRGEQCEICNAPQRPWVGLTDDEIKAIVGPYGDTPIKGYTRKLFD
jgi:hypothetical protein